MQERVRLAYPTTMDGTEYACRDLAASMRVNSIDQSVSEHGFMRILQSGFKFEAYRTLQDNWDQVLLFTTVVVF
jgi:hypothetical protein